MNRTSEKAKIYKKAHMSKMAKTSRHAGKAKMSKQAKNASMAKENKLAEVDQNGTSTGMATNDLMAEMK